MQFTAVQLNGPAPTYAYLGFATAFHKATNSMFLTSGYYVDYTVATPGTYSFKQDQLKVRTLTRSLLASIRKPDRLAYIACVLSGRFGS